MKIHGLVGLCVLLAGTEATPAASGKLSSPVARAALAGIAAMAVRQFTSAARRRR